MSETKEGDYKSQGNAAYKAKDYGLAIEHYSKAIAAAPKSDTAALCLCNRAICHGVLKNWAQSAKDAQSCVDIKADWVKGYQRLGIALRKSGKPLEAIKALEKGLAANPNNADLKKALADAQARLAKSLSSDNSGASNRGSSKQAQEAMEHYKKDFMNQQQRQRQLSSQLQETKLKIEKYEREEKKSKLVFSDLQNIDKSSNIYSAVGKCFISTSFARATKNIDTETQKVSEQVARLRKRKIGLESQFEDSQRQLKEMDKILHN
jgi:tetratricopeptide (TPR) repeat protein|tara:strand:- start:111 stop:902 length:792 start_codon:yes stop_codon:yes gene_type:complete